MAANQKLTALLKGRAIMGSETQDGKLLVHFDDGSVMTVKTGGAVKGDAAGTVKGVRQQGTTLDLDTEEGGTLEITTAEVTSSVMVRAADHTMEYAD